MATILEFRNQPRTPMGARSSGMASAEIVIFPGVRYERWTGEPPPPPKPRKASRRDTLKLED